MEHFYDGQVRRYITQMVRMLSNFSYKDSAGQLVEVPVLYGDLTRQVSQIMRDNSENKIPSAPRMAVYITGLEQDATRLSDASYVNKLNIRERAYDDNDNEYLNKEGKNYTVERLMPTPYTLSVNADLWTTNTDQKLQILEQILMLFNPSLEIQTTDNYVDWTSLSVVNLSGLTFSSRSIPVGVDSEIDVATLSFTTPIFISPPVKVKRLGVITNIITSIFNEKAGTIDLDLSRPAIQAWDDQPRARNSSIDILKTDSDGNVVTEQQDEAIAKYDVDSVLGTAHDNYDLLVMNGTAKLIGKGVVGAETWTGFIKSMPFDFSGGVTQLKLQRTDYTNELTGTVQINPTNEYELTINWDEDSLPTDTVINGPNGNRSKIDYIINPQKTNPQSLLSESPRILILGDINPSENVGQDVGETPDNYRYDGPDAWKNLDGTDFVAGENDIVEWDGSRWTVVFDASEYEDSTITYTTNLNTGIQYKFIDGQWILSYDGEYPNGTWRLDF